MNKESTSKISSGPAKPDGQRQVPFGSNGIRLSTCEWLVVAVVCAAMLLFWPRLWERFEKFEPGPDRRLPYELSSDYWLYGQYCREACSQYETVVIGDSVIWGHYVSADNTLSAGLNKIAGREQFANLGVDGFHPAALGGLVKYYGRAISGKKVIIQLNPLWMSSAKHDLQTEKEWRFNHPRLVPQFTPKIPCYKESYSGRISIAVGRCVPLLGWTSHLKIAYFDNMDLPTWTMEHPYANPLAAVTLTPGAPPDDSLVENSSWIEKGRTKDDLQWVEPATSLQWRFFRQTVELLKARGNTVFVMVGPFNEHMLKNDSLNVYRKLKDEIGKWLSENKIPYYMPVPLPSEVYCDASHPIAQGYALLARQLFENDSFKSTILGGD